ncbi:hypothetical protein KR767_16990 [Luteibacter anthropi]|uniref:Uncharacterized protein n=1 Tax=Luteibacter anthropi TaxID=564369 RepID=A0A7X5U7X8_9GAMM|nr:hypothetical protein [Luteibacter anthropi]NII05492.1 hypothetical protein [Luteibacter anthropi]URX61737.1 hypothetical protein KR767_16990 [Luteibacter anthropi]
MSIEAKKDDLARAAAELVLRELDEIEARDIFGGDGGWVKVGPVQPVPPGKPGGPVTSQPKAPGA